MFELLLLIILISIALGVSLQSAFWGLVAFSAGAFVLFIVAGITGFGVSLLANRIRQANTPQAKKARQVRWRQRVADGVTGVVVFLVLLVPFPLGFLAASLANGNMVLALLLTALPFLAELFCFYKYAQKLLDKKR